MNYILPIIVSLIVYFVVGMLWYGPLFGKAWLKLKDMSEKEAQEGQGVMAYSAVSGLVSLIIMSYFIERLNPETWFEGLTIGLVLATFASAMGANSVIYDKLEGIGNRLKEWFLYMGYIVVTLGIASIIITLVR